MDSGIAICSIVCAFVCRLHTPSYNCNFTYIAVGDDVKTVKPTATLLADLRGAYLYTAQKSNSHYAPRVLVRFVNRGPATEHYATACYADRVHSGKHNVTVRRPSVCPSVCPTGILTVTRQGAAGDARPA